MMGILSGKVAIVTGASSGIGRACAVKLGAMDAHLVVAYSPQADGGTGPADESARLVREVGASCDSVAADLTDGDAIASLVEGTVDRCGTLDIVINCAAINPIRPLTQITDEEFDRAFAINSKGAFQLMRHTGQHIADGGRIVMFSSAASRVGNTVGAIYGGSKASVEAFTRALAWELGPRGVTVNTVTPGITDTPMLLDHFRERGPAMSPFGRLGTPEDVADVVSLLVRPEAHWLTGQNINAGGGASMAHG